MVWIVLAAALLIGGGRKLLLAWRARKAIARISEPNVAAEEIEAVAEHGRAGVGELLRIFSTSESEPQRQAAGRGARGSGFLTSSSPKKRKRLSVGVSM